jgi:hypothetical protein
MPWLRRVVPPIEVAPTTIGTSRACVLAGTAVGSTAGLTFSLRLVETHKPVGVQHSTRNLPFRLSVLSPFRHSGVDCLVDIETAGERGAQLAIAG